MTGPEHYRAAEDLLDEPLGENPEHAWRFIMQAQVHATLALAAATAMGIDLVQRVRWDEQIARVGGQP